VVQRGQFLERPAIIACGGLTLDGLYHRGDRMPPLLLCPSPGPGGGMDAPALAEMAWAAARAGHASLRFNQRGVGGSQGEPDVAAAAQDALAALEHLAGSTGAERFAVAGVGGGCATAVEVARRERRVARLVLVVPVRAPVLEGVAAPALVLVPALEPAVPGVEEAVEGRGRVEVVSEADLHFHAGLPEVGRLAVEWIGRGALRSV
jgi:alpha/beta superfamily hydrolase